MSCVPFFSPEFGFVFFVKERANVGVAEVIDKDHNDVWQTIRTFCGIDRISQQRLQRHQIEATKNQGE